METLLALGRTLPFAFTSGVNLYATVLVVGLATRFDWAPLPGAFDVFGDWRVLSAAGALYLIEFVADKVPWVDTAWDAVHTVVRPIGGAVVAIVALGDASPGFQAAAGLLGAGLAATAHATKAGTRAAINLSPEPFTNVAASLLEDVLVVALVVLAIVLPLLALAATALLLAGALLLASRLLRLRRRARA